MISIIILVGCSDDERKTPLEMGIGWEIRNSGQKLFHGDYFEMAHMNLVGTAGWCMGEP